VSFLWKLTGISKRLRRTRRSTVLYEDADFETVARFVPELRQHRLSAGPL
jgi:hypothetical protein